jgi:hypothetical protein
MALDTQRLPDVQRTVRWAAMPDPVVAFDESGNTGPHLLDDAQPIFALASVLLDDGVTAELLAPLAHRDGEAKFSVLRHDPEGQALLLALLRSPQLTPRTARVSVFHKPYMVVAKMVDLLMEPGFFARGMDEEFRREGHALHWPTTLYELGPEQLGATWHELVVAFVDSVRTPSTQRTARVRDAIDEALATAPDARLQFPLEIFAEQATGALANKQPVDPLDPALPALVEHIDFWGQMIGQFHVRHDQADSLKRYRRHLRALSDRSIEPYDFVANDRVVHFPLQAVSIEFVDSKAVRQVQVADLLAGACSFQQAAFERFSSDANFARAVAETGIRRLFDHFVAPPEFVRRSMQGVEDIEP